MAKTFKRRIPKKTVKKYNKSMFRKRLPPLGAPYSIKRRLKYQSQNNITPGALGSVGGIVFRANSLYDPDLTGTGHQPRYFDQYCASDNSTGMYKQYVVLGAKIKVAFMTTDTDEFIKCGITPKDTTALYSSGLNYNEAKGGVSKTLGPRDSGAGHKVLTYYWSSKKWFGNKINSDREVSGTYNTNPTNECFLHLWCYSQHGTTVSDVVLDVNIEYLVLFKQPVTPLAS